MIHIDKEYIRGISLFSLPKHFNSIFRSLYDLYSFYSMQKNNLKKNKMRKKNSRWASIRRHICHWFLYFIFHFHVRFAFTFSFPLRFQFNFQCPTKSILFFISLEFCLFAFFINISEIRLSMGLAFLYMYITDKSIIFFIRISNLQYFLSFYFPSSSHFDYVWDLYVFFFLSLLILFHFRYSIKRFDIYYQCTRPSLTRISLLISCFSLDFFPFYCFVLFYFRSPSILHSNRNWATSICPKMFIFVSQSVNSSFSFSVIYIAKTQNQNNKCI